MATRPSTYLNWVPSGSASYIQQPTSGQMTTGWTGGEAPPFQYMNWLFYYCDQWIQWLDTFTQTLQTAAGITASSVAATGTANMTINQYSMTVNSPTGIIQGQLISCANFPANTFVTGIAGSVVSTSQAATANGSTIAVTFNHNFATSAYTSVQTQLDALDAAINTHLGVLSNGVSTFTPSGGSPTLNVTQANNGSQIQVNTTNNVGSIQLPNPAAFKNCSFSIQDIAGTFGTNALTLKQFASETIHGLAGSLVLSSPYGDWVVFCDGTNYWLK